MMDAFTAEEAAWIASTSDREAAKWVVRYARAFNALNVGPLTEGLAPAATYESQSVFDKLVGAERLLDYWRNKFDSIRGSDRVVATELALLPGGQPCAAIYQAASAEDTNWLDVPLALMTIRTNPEGQATSFLMITCAPSPAAARGARIYPGRTEVPAVHPRRFVRASPGFDEITLYVFYLDGRNWADRAMAESVAEVRRELAGIQVVALVYQEIDTRPEWEARSAFAFNGFPSVGAMFKGKPIYRHQGLIAGADLVRALRDTSPLYVAGASSNG